MRVWVLIGLVGCYAPRAAPGAPCNSDSECPSGQMCVAGTCGGTPAGSDTPDASPDAAAGGGTDAMMTIDDADGDGVLDVTDNCPMIANADQANEDGDRFGDVCDPCPVEANDTPSDPDGDGVADGCDPHPTTAGDAIALFEGFHHGLPASWQAVGTVMATGDDLQMVGVAGNHGALVLPISAPASGTLTTAATIMATFGGTSNDADYGPAYPWDPTQDDGVFCELYSPDAGSTTGRYLSLWDSLKSKEFGNKPLAWVTGTSYQLAFTRTGSSYRCTSGNTVATATTDSVPAQPKVAVYAYSSTVNVAWVMLVTSP